MIIKLKDGTEILASVAQADGAKEAIENGDMSISINGVWVRTDWIAVIKPGGNSEADKVPAHMRLERPDHRGQESPAKEALRQRFNKA